MLFNNYKAMLLVFKFLALAHLMTVAKNFRKLSLRKKNKTVNINVKFLLK